MRDTFDSWRQKFQRTDRPVLVDSVVQLLDRFLYSSPRRAVGSVHVRDGANVQGLLGTFVPLGPWSWVMGGWRRPKACGGSVF